MAIVSYKSGAQIVRKFENVFADFPVVGIQVADVITIGVDNASGADVTIEYTMDDESQITGGTAVWINAVTVANGADAFIVTEYGPTGVKITASSGGAIAWIKS